MSDRRKANETPRQVFGGRLFCCLLLAATMAGCHKPEGQGPGKGRPGGGMAVPVLAAQAVARDMPIEVTAIANVQPFSSVTIRSRITGELLKAHFKEGDDVKAGDLLFTIDPRSPQASLRQAEANVKRSQAQLESARLDFERTRKLLESGISAAEDFERARAAFQGLEATVLADRAALSNAALNVEFTEIRSPISGRTGSLMVKEGNIVKAEDDRLVTINQVKPIYVAFAVPERELPAIRARMGQSTLAVAVTLPGSTNVIAEGDLSFIENSVDVTTGTILLRATFKNDNNALWPGQFLQARLVVDLLKGATVVPSQAVQSSQAGEFVFVVTADQTVEKRLVQLGLTREGWAVISGGIKPGEMVVTDGQLRLAPKSKVTVQQRGEPGATNAPAKGT